MSSLDSFDRKFCVWGSPASSEMGMTYRGIEMVYKNFNFETVAKYGLTPIFRIRSEERVETGSSFDETVNKRVVQQTFKPRRLSDVLSDVDGFISACLENNMKSMGIVALRSRDIDYLVRVVTQYLKGQLLFKHDVGLSVTIDEEGNINVHPYFFEIDEWKYVTRIMPRAALVNIDEISQEQLAEIEEFDLQIRKR
jgi:hypothetical protein